MKIVNWNIEWMNKWFSGNENPRWGSGSLSETDAKSVAGRVSRVIKALDPDLLCIQEGPSSLAEMNLFLDEFLSDGSGQIYHPLIGRDGAQQKLYVLAKKGGKVSSFDYATDNLTLDLQQEWSADVNGDLLLEPYDFTRQPLVVDVEPTEGPAFRIIDLHTKSKYVHGGKALFNNPEKKQTFIAQAMMARRRISAEAFRLRTYLDDLLKDEPNAHIIVTGDFNDGPGQDFFERSYLTHNVTDILLGSTFYPSLIFNHPILERVPTPALFTSRFDDFVDNIQDRPLLLDHFVVSPAVASHVSNAGIGHTEFEDELENTGNDARVDRPSDHRPIFLELSHV